jgi:hypothetical protein
MGDFFASQAIAIIRLLFFLGFNYLGLKLIMNNSNSKSDTFIAVILLILAEVSLFFGSPSE